MTMLEIPEKTCPFCGQLKIWKEVIGYVHRTTGEVSCPTNDS